MTTVLLQFGAILFNATFLTRTVDRGSDEPHILRHAWFPDQSLAQQGGEQSLIIDTGAMHVEPIF